MDIARKLADGNPGAISVIVQLLSSQHDPDDFMGGMGSLLALDTHGIYGSNVWVLFKDTCGSSILNVVTALRAVQLGLYTERDLWRHIDERKRIDSLALYNVVKARLPNFNPQADQVITA